jgi:tetratricopeptide (TPR) repeat protein
MSLRGKLDDCFARLDGCGAEPELIALCKRCLAFEPADRPAEAGAVAVAVAGLRAAAEERARTAERDQAAAAAQAAERHKRRRLWLGAAVALALAVIGGLSAVLAVQAQARYDLEAKNVELSAAQAKVEARNRELADERTKVEERFELAQKAIALFHSGVSEDFLLKNKEFESLRTKLLMAAASFYADLEKLLAGQTDVKSRQALAAAYFQLGELTDKILNKEEALAVHRKALALRQELAAPKGADVETRLDVARSLEKVGLLLSTTGHNPEGLAALQEQQALVERLEVEHPTDTVRSVLAQNHYTIGIVHHFAGKPEKALTAWRKASSILQKLAEAKPADTELQHNLARTFNNLGLALVNTGKPEEALMSFRKSLAIRQKLAEANPTVTEFQVGPARTQGNIGFLLSVTGRPEEALASYLETLAGFLQVANANPAVTEFQLALANTQTNIGRQLDRLKRLAEAFTALEAGLVIRQQLAKADPNNVNYRRVLGESHAFRGGARVRARQPAEAAADLRRALELWARLPSLDIEIQVERSRALALLAGLGGDANSGVTRDEAQRFADQAVIALADAVKVGWAYPSELKEPDFEALRGRDDFRKLLAELSAKAGPKAKRID